MNQKHSPGPWRVEYLWKMYNIIDGDNDLITDVCGRNDHADATLIAAAPEMLEAINSMVDFYDRKENSATAWLISIDLCRKAKAKAEGNVQPETI